MLSAYARRVRENQAELSAGPKIPIKRLLDVMHSSGDLTLICHCKFINNAEVF